MIPETFGKITLINGDCMDYLRSLPDNAFELAVCDPPYGDANFQTPPRQAMNRDGGGWFSRYKRPLEQIRSEVRQIQTSQAAYALSRGDLHDTSGNYPPNILRMKTLRKVYGGILPPMKNISRNCFVSVKIKSFGAAITLPCHRADVSLFGASLQSPNNFLWQWQNMRGLLSTPMQRSLNTLRKGQQKSHAFTLHKSPSRYILGY